jgi:hypothetical protein
MTPRCRHRLGSGPARSPSPSGAGRDSPQRRVVETGSGVEGRPARSTCRNGHFTRNLPPEPRALVHYGRRRGSSSEDVPGGRCPDTDDACVAALPPHARVVAAFSGVTPASHGCGSAGVAEPISGTRTFRTQRMQAREVGMDPLHEYQTWAGSHGELCPRGRWHASPLSSQGSARPPQGRPGIEALRRDGSSLRARPRQSPAVTGTDRPDRERTVPPRGAALTVGGGAAARGRRSGTPAGRSAGAHRARSRRAAAAPPDRAACRCRARCRAAVSRPGRL